MFPTTRYALISDGYKFENYSRCKACGQQIEWWSTPRGRKIPMNQMLGGESAAKAHFSSCSQAPPLFRGAGA